MVLIVMIVIAFLVISTMQSTTMDAHTSANDSDRQLAMQNAQSGLRNAEDDIRSWGEDNDNEDKIFKFDCKCTDHRCAAKGLEEKNMGTKRFELSCNDTKNLEEVWRRKNDTGEYLLSTPINSQNAQNYDYAIEYLGKNSDNKFLFRITAKGWGENPSSTGMVQEVVEATMPYLNI